MNPTTLSASFMLLLLLTSALGAAESPTPDTTPAATPPVRIPVKVVAGKLIVACDVSTSARRLPVNLFLELDTKCGLQLHNQAAGALRSEGRDGSTRPIAIHLGDLEIVVEKREHGDQDFLDDFTRYHSKDMDENAVVGTIGSEILRDYFIALELGEGFIYLGKPRPPTEDARAPIEGVTVVPITEVNDLVWLPARHEDGSPGALAIGTSRHDSVVDAALAQAKGAPDGNLPSLTVGELDLTERVAFRPEEVIQVHPDGVVGILGLGALNSLRVEIDRVNRVARIVPTEPADFPEEDLAFHQALVADDGDEMQDFLEAHPEARAAREAADLLLDLRIDEDAGEEELAFALEQIQKQQPEDLRATRMLDLMEELVEQQLPRLALQAGDLGIPAGRDDRYPETVHSIHARMGELYLEDSLAAEDEETKAATGKEAWRHLLSAAFGTPEDGRVNLALGRYYESVGRNKRAYSRFVQAVIKPETGPEAFEGLSRLSGGSISVDRIEKLIAGKTHAFGAATTYEPTEEEDTGRVVLLEFFTNPNLGDAERGGAIGGALANDGLVSHFEYEHAAFITYHLPVPKLVPTSNTLGTAAAAFYDPRLPPYVHVINGVTSGPGGGKWREKEQIYIACRDRAVAQRKKAPEVTLELEAKVAVGEDGEATVSGELIVRGEDDPGRTVHLVLVERGVLFPGKSEIVIHRNLARAALTSSPIGDMLILSEGQAKVPFERSLREIRDANEAYLDEQIEAGAGSVVKMCLDIDPEQVSVVAFVRDIMSKEVLQAIQVDAELIEHEDE